MKNTTLICSIALAAFATFSVGCATRAEVDTKSHKVLMSMSKTLSSAEHLSFTAVRDLDRQLIENPGMIGKATVHVDIDRPDQAKATVKGEGKSRTFYLSKDGSAIHDDKKGLYVRFPGFVSLDKTLDAAAEQFDVHIPIQDFVSNNPYRGLVMGSDSIAHTGTVTVGEQICDKLQGRREDLEWELWIGSVDKLPRRFVVNVADLKGSDHLVIDFKKWDLAVEHPDGSLAFTPSETDREIQFLPDDGAKAAAE